MPATPEPRVAFLTPIEARALIDAAAPHLRPLIVFLIGTGARMSEALELDWRDVDLAAGRATFSRTKGRRPGGGRIRRIDLYPAVRAALAALPHRDGRVFRPVYRVKRDADNRDGLVTGDAYRDSGRHGGGQIKRAWSGACRRAGLGEVVDGRFVARVRPHDLRHTAATWHYAMHRDLLALQQ